MCRVLLLLGLLSVSVTAAEYRVFQQKGSAVLKATEENNVLILQSSGQKNQKSVTCACRAVKKGELKEKINTLSFEVKGDGSDSFASVFIGDVKYLLNGGYETTFSIKSKEWTQVEIPISDFVQNVKPWSVKKMDGSAMTLNPKRIKFVGFGRGMKLSHFLRHPNYAFNIRNIRFEWKKPVEKTALKSGLKRLKEKLKKGQNVHVLLLGDSITYQGKKLNHTYYAFEELKKKYKSKVTISNMAVGGNSVREGNVMLPQALSTMPKPDLAVIFYGANDCKSLKESSGFSDIVFEKQIEHFVHRINRLTSGSCEYLFVNGVPRVEKSSLKSTGEVEKITPAYSRLSKKYNLALCDTISAFNSLPNDKKKLYYKDTVHQTPEGLQFIGRLIADSIKK